MNCFVNLGLNSNSNHYVACLLIFLLHFSPQLLNPSNCNSISNREGEEQTCTDGEQQRLDGQVCVLSFTFSAGAVLWMLSGLGIVLLPSRMHNLMCLWPIRSKSCAMGLGVVLKIWVTSISMEGVLVGEDLNGCAFVYGSLSFVDKVSCGVLLYVLESYQGSNKISSNLGMAFGYSVTRLGLGLVPAACSLLLAIVAYTMDLPDTQRRLLVEPLLA